MTAGRPKLYNDEDIEKMGQELINLSSSEGVYHVTEFSEAYQKSPTWVYEIARDYPRFSEYLTRARNILGCKLLKKAIEENPSLYIQKTFIKRYLSNEYEDIEKWTKEDVELEAKAKAEAAKQVNQQDIHPIILQTLEELSKFKHGSSSQ